MCFRSEVPWAQVQGRDVVIDGEDVAVERHSSRVVSTEESVPE